MKFLKISPNKKMIKIGDDIKTANWYYLDKCSLEGIKENDEVDFESVNKAGSNFLTKINKKGSVKKEEPKQQEVQKKVEPTNGTSNYKKTELLEIKEDSKSTEVHIGYITAKTMLSLQSVITEHNIGEIITKVFESYESKMKG